MSKPNERFSLIAFFGLSYAWTWVCWWTVAARASSDFSLPISNESLATVGQFGPFVAALVVIFADSGLAGLGEFAGRFARWRAHSIWLVVSLTLAPLLMLTAIVSHAYLGGTLAALKFRDTWTTLPAHFIYTLLLCGPLGEEPGWRGFALPRLQARCGSVMASLWLGLLWAGWHLPLWWINPSPPPYGLYVASAVLMTLLFTWLFNHTHGSVLYALFFHASMNTAGVRLPEVPAHIAWVIVLFAAATIILVFDRSLGATSGSLLSREALRDLPAPETGSGA
jgi:membrane protease YdiL (CAAX protease family)